MKKYMLLLVTVCTCPSAQASEVWDNEIYSNFQFVADTVETPQEIIIKNIGVTFQSNLRGKQSTSFNVLRSSSSPSSAKTSAIIELCYKYGAQTLVNYTKTDLLYKDLVLAYDSTDAKNFDFYWIESSEAFAVSQIVCRK
jgi:hypothetical protein